MSHTRHAVFRRSVFILLGACTCFQSRASSLAEMYAKAQAYDAEYLVARYQAEIALEQERESQAGVRPVVDLRFDASYTNQNIRESESILFRPGRTEFPTVAATLSVTQPVYRAEIFRRLPRSRAETKEAESRLVAAEHELIVRLCEAVFRMLASKDNLDLTIAERESLGQQLEEAEERIAAGLARMTELHEVRARYAVAEAEEVAARATVEDSRQAVAQITGQFPEEIPQLDESFPLVGPDRPDVEEWVEVARFQNARVRSRQAAVDIAVQGVREQKGARLPSVDLVATFSERRSGGTIFGSQGGTDISTGDLAFRVAIPIYEGGRTSARTQAAIRTQRIRETELDFESRRVERETRAAFNGVVGGISRVEALTQSVFSLEAELEAKRESLKSGLTTRREVLDAIRELFLSERDLSEARYQYLLSRLKLKQAAGTLGPHDLGRIDEYLQ